MKDMLRVGVFTSTHGLKGEIKVFPTTDDRKRFEDLKKVVMEKNTQQQLRRKTPETMELEIQNVRYFKQYVILKFRGIDDINQIESWKGANLWIDREDAVPLEEDEYFISDLIGLKVINQEDGMELGILEDVLQTGANDVYQVKTVAGLTKSGQLLLPAIADCIREVSLERGEIVVHVMKGLLDL